MLRFITAALLALPGCAAAHGTGHAAPGPAPAGKAVNRWGAGYFPNVEVVSQDGKRLHFYDDVLKGRSLALNVMYTSCTDACPLETAHLAQLQRVLGAHMGRDILFVSITLDPEHDTPDVLKAYAARFDVGPGWLFLTGNREDLRLVIRKLGLSRTADVFSRDGHTPSLMVGNEPTGQWMRNSAVDNPVFLAATIGNFLGWPQADPGRSYAQARPLALGKGQYLFESRCSACHSLGDGRRIGPDLLDVTTRRDPAWIARYVSAPERLRAALDPIALALSERYRDVRMPNLDLGAADVADLIRYLQARSRAAAAQAGP